MNITYPVNGTIPLTIELPSLWMNSIVSVIGASIFPAMLLLLYREQIVSYLALVGSLMNKLKKKSGMEVILISDVIDEKIATKFENILERATEKGIENIILILHTLGGIEFYASRIISAIKEFPGKIHCYIPRYAMSAGTYIALACKGIYMGEKSSLGAVDPQIGILFWVHSSKAWETIIKKKGKKAKDESWAMYLYAKQYKKMMKDILGTMPLIKNNKKLKDFLIEGNIPHSQQLNMQVLKRKGLAVKEIVWPEVYKMVAKNPKGIRTTVKMWGK